MPVKLTAVTRPQGNNRAVVEGRAPVPGFALDFQQVPVLVHAFRRMVRELAYDVCEMAFTTYLCAKAHGTPFTALPIFLVRGFHHGAIVHSPAGGAKTPADLAGRPVGVSRGYTVTTGVWARGILQDEYGLDLDRVTWRPSGDEHVARYRPPRNVLPLPPGSDLPALVASGDLAAAVGVEDGGQPLIADPVGAGFAALRERGLYPINHLVVVRDATLRANPGLAAALFEAFAAAKREYVAGLSTPDNPTDRMYRRVLDITGEDPLPYGVAPNRAMIDQLVGHAVRQRILDRRPAVAEMFDESTLHLTA
ncbi:substrate-binding domain-containing protein [Phytohabitans suffuscus]|nr:ABC transporter substrate-binding protein [Phytohabitans suffuscus]